MIDSKRTTTLITALYLIFPALVVFPGLIFLSGLSQPEIFFNDFSFSLSPLGINLSSHLVWQSFFAVAILISILGYVIIRRLHINFANMEEFTKELFESESKFHALFESADDGMFILNMQGNIIEVNHSGYTRLGYKKGELLGKSIAILDSPEFSKKVPERIAKIEKEGKAKFEAAHVHKNGTVISVEVNACIMEIAEQKVLFSIARDITMRKEMEQALREREAKYRAVTETMTDGFWIVDMEGRFLEINDSYLEHSGYSREELFSMRVSDVEANEIPEGRAFRVDEIIRDGCDRFESLHKTKDGTLWPVEIVPSHWPIGNGLCFVFIIDITERKRNNEQIVLMAKVFQNALEAMFITDKENRIININNSFTRLTGYTLDEVKGQDPVILSSGNNSSDFYKEMWESILTKGTWQGEIQDRRKDGSTYWKLLSIKTVINGNNKIAYYIASFIDITDRKHEENEMRQLAYFDVLTGLLNRQSLVDVMEKEIPKATRNRTKIALLFIDLDNFKVINDTLGHSIGDGLLIAVAKEIQGTLRESDIVARLGGDEFVVILTDLVDGNRAAVVARKIVNRISKVHQIDENDIYTSPSIGISLFPDDGKDLKSLMQNADTAMYKAKNEGGNHFNFFNLT